MLRSENFAQSVRADFEARKTALEALVSLATFRLFLKKKSTIGQDCRKNVQMALDESKARFCSKCEWKKFVLSAGGLGPHRAGGFGPPRAWKGMRTIEIKEKTIQKGQNGRNRSVDLLHLKLCSALIVICGWYWQKMNKGKHETNCWLLLNQNCTSDPVIKITYCVLNLENSLSLATNSKPDHGSEARRPSSHKASGSFLLRLVLPRA